ncbi:hypothetical protein DICPUDRAFT_43840 [Dictyostelium purpureum]|uniref:Cytochrome P450 family protein n=1 Tax=Dictyostelium purpureum TaxID=5786 RepID=F1A4X1_DICPU|nr:uncharacterized protein DICPUDRAFT_43840 [Dictyostelium purpureum]EGC28757.1 hypothetical protein DICPUDRAFT_43840 [Dictyostelium purpureum]|eukprot:XP_003294715.1 hypothetical protein DICPUDRAFT_43840 [Dictyostelium purpureum]
MAILSVVVSLFTFYCFYSGYKKYKRVHESELKGPFPLPIIGNFHQISRLPHRDLTNMVKKYGNIFRVYFGDIYTVVVSDPLLVREMFVKNADIFQDRLETPLTKHGSLYHGTTTSNGEYWVRNRDIVSRAMKKTNIKHVYELLNEEIDRIVTVMKRMNSSGESFDPRYNLTKFTTCAMFKYIFDEVLTDEKESHDKVKQIIDPMERLFKLMGGGNLFDSLDIGQPFYSLYLKYTEKDFDKILNFVKVRLNEHIETYNPDNTRDLLDVLIKEYGVDTEEDRFSIITTCGDFLFAGVETSATALEYMLLMLTNRPEIQDKAYSEIKHHLGKRNKVLLSDRSSLIYTNAVIKETLRLKMVTAFGLPRKCSEDCMIGEYFIPKNSQILVNFHALAMNKDYYSNPETFDPSRFLGDTNQAFIPFSIGPRSCVGSQFAQDEIFICLSNILLNFRLKSIDGNKIDEEEVYGLTLKPKSPYKINLELR